MDKRKSINEELRELGAKRLLGVSPQEVGQAPPAGYFDGLADSVLAKARQPAATRGLRVKRRAWLAVAATVALLLSASWWYLSQPAPPTKALALEGISNDAIVDYVEANIDEFETEWLEDLAAEAGAEWAYEPEFDLPAESVEEYLQMEDEGLFAEPADLF